MAIRAVPDRNVIVADKSCFQQQQQLQQQPVVGLAIATCCHHACSYEDYAGKEWYHQTGKFTVAEFEVLKIWSGWAALLEDDLKKYNKKGNAGENEEEEEETAIDQLATATVDNNENNTKKNINISSHSKVEATTDTIAAASLRPTGITREEMALLGWKTKRILDQGRVEHINKHYNMIAKQIKYCDRSLSPECVMIIATQK